MKNKGGRPITHGLRYTKIYGVWANMKQRCSNPNLSNYKDYGGRGITVCDEWRTFVGFYNDMSKNYKEGLEIDRIDNDGNYCKKNCHWVTRHKQARNKRATILFNGETALEASKRLGGSKYLVGNRLRIGWTKELAFSKPI